MIDVIDVFVALLPVVLGPELNFAQAAPEHLDARAAVALHAVEPYLDC